MSRIIQGKQFLKGLLPKHYKETVWECDGFFASLVEFPRHRKMGRRQFEEFIIKTRKKFGKNMITLYLRDPAGSFVINFRNDNKRIVFFEKKLEELTPHEEYINLIDLKKVREGE